MKLREVAARPSEAGEEPDKPTDGIEFPAVASSNDATVRDSLERLLELGALAATRLPTEVAALKH